jgi:hypothetical protein
MTPPRVGLVSAVCFLRGVPRPRLSVPDHDFQRSRRVHSESTSGGLSLTTTKTTKTTDYDEGLRRPATEDASVCYNDETSAFTIRPAGGTSTRSSLG